ncbi:uncharacterized protein LOC135834571 [Planococcus citri]|uniref:uncharacterized protein LOC135834571 n=1 Tax=Planococcus citri TaxID=170843 RepID=UPI0031F7A3BB
MTDLPQRTKFIILIWLTTNLSSPISCLRENNTLELSCQITTSHKLANGTHKDVNQIKAINKCDESYENKEVIKKCEYLVDSKSSSSPTLFKPVTNSFKNTTYWNEYCATCNYQTEELESWPSWSKLEAVDFVCGIYQLEVQLGSAATQHQLTKNYIKNGLELISKLNNSTELQCTMEENWPMNLLNFTLPCLTAEFRKSRQNRLNSCQYVRNNGRICTSMWLIIEGLDFWVDKNDDIRLFNESFRYKFDQSEYTLERGADNVVYVCEKIVKNYKVRYWVKIVTLVCSVVFVITYLVLNFNKRYLQSFPNKIIYSYSLGLMMMYIFLTWAYFLFIESCILFFLAQFSWLFHFFWTVIISLEFCGLTYCTLRKRRVTISAQHKKYLIHCFFGYILPIIIPVIYFLILETPENKCPPVQGYFSVPCVPAKKSAAEYFMEILLYIFDYSFTFFIPVLFLLQASVLIYLTKCGPTQIRSTANRNHLIVLIKMGYIMGAHWLLYELCFWYGFSNSFAYLSVQMISELSIDLQGVFVFFAFGFKRRMLIYVLKICGCEGSKFTQKVGDDVLESSVRLQSLSMDESITTDKTV